MLGVNVNVRLEKKVYEAKKIKYELLAGLDEGIISAKNEILIGIIGFLNSSITEMDEELERFNRSYKESKDKSFYK